MTQEDCESLIKDAVANLKPFDPDITIDNRIVDAFRTTSRALFIPPTCHSIKQSLRVSSMNVNDMIWKDIPIVQKRSERDDKIESASSQPSINLLILHLLDIQPGEIVLEVGSGSGWLLAMLRRLTTSRGKVVGLEVDRYLRQFSESALGHVNLNDVEVHGHDIFEKQSLNETFDKVVFTAAIPYIPERVWNALRPKSVIVAPLVIRAKADELTRLTLVSHGLLQSDYAKPVTFTRCLGSGWTPFYQEESFASTLTSLFCLEDRSLTRRAWFGDGKAAGLSSRAAAFRAFLCKGSCRYFDYLDNLPDCGEAGDRPLFGLCDVELGSLVTVDRWQVRAYGNRACYDELFDLLRRWADALLIDAHILALSVSHGDNAAREAAFVHKRRSDVFRWAQPSLEFDPAGRPHCACARSPL